MLTRFGIFAVAALLHAGATGVAQEAPGARALMSFDTLHHDVIAEHGNERMSSSTLIGIGMDVTARLLETNQIANNSQIMAAIGLGVQVGVQLPFSRTHETEADLIGLDLMARAGFNPKESVNLWENMQKASGGKRQPEFLSTHPAPTTRINRLSQNMPDAVALYKQASSFPKCKA